MSYKAKPFYLASPDISTMQAVTDSFQKDWFPLHSFQKDLVLYHYTTLDGLRGILQTNSLWCTDPSPLGDPMELKYGKRLVLDKLNEKIIVEKNILTVEILKKLMNYLEFLDPSFYRVFIACFCEDDNLLSQWRAYGRKGVGYNIGFNIKTDTMYSNILENHSDESYLILRKIIYNPEQQDEMISNNISNIIDEAKKVEDVLKSGGEISKQWTTEAALETVNILFDMILSLKSPVFKEEKEWRLIKVLDPDRRPELLKFRNINERLTPYLDTYIYDKVKDNYLCPISNIKIGPTLDGNMTKSNLKIFVKNLATSDTNIKINADDISIETAGYVLR